MTLISKGPNVINLRVHTKSFQNQVLQLHLILGAERRLGRQGLDLGRLTVVQEEVDQIR